MPCATTLECGSCAEILSGSTKIKAIRMSSGPARKRLRNITSVLRCAQDGSEILREGRTRHHFAATHGLRLVGELALHVREKSNYSEIFPDRSEALDGREGLVARIQIENNEFGRGLEQCQECVAVCGDFQLEAEMPGRFRDLHLKKQIVHHRHDSSHAGCSLLALPIMRHFNFLSCFRVRCIHRLGGASCSRV